MSVTAQPMDLSVIVPVFNESESISNTHQVLTQVLAKMPVNWEIVYINDGSDDESLQILKTLISVNTRLIDLRRNKGHMTALSVGMKESRGEFVVTIDADLQDPPSYIPEMYSIAVSKRAHMDSPDVVQAVRTDRSSDSFFKKKTASLYYKWIRGITGVAITPHSADFRLMSREAVNIINNLHERNKVLRLLIPELGLRTVNIEIVRAKREFGKTKYNFMRMFSLTIQSVISFTTKPLQILAFFGTIVSIVFLLLSFGCALLWYFSNTIPGWTSLVLLILSTNAALFASIGILGEYIGRIFVQVQNRPEAVYSEIYSNKLSNPDL
jgi:dolichol-phosphate mannosyltransferase